MRCLMCHEEIGNGRNLSELLFEEDVLCHSCRSKWTKQIEHFELNGVKGMSYWNYDDIFSSYLIQFKECNDEALKDAFLFPIKKEVKRYLKGRTLLLMPSSKSKLKARGFSHLKEMYEQLELPMLEPFEKMNEVDQKELSAEGRKQMEYSIRLKPSVKIPKKVAVVDDVITTGASIKGALHALEGTDTNIRIFSASKVEKSLYS